MMKGRSKNSTVTALYTGNGFRLLKARILSSLRCTIFENATTSGGGMLYALHICLAASWPWVGHDPRLVSFDYMLHGVELFQYS